MKSESGFSFAIASQPFHMILTRPSCFLVCIFFSIILLGFQCFGWNFWLIRHTSIAHKTNLMFIVWKISFQFPISMYQWFLCVTSLSNFSWHIFANFEANNQILRSFFNVSYWPGLSLVKIIKYYGCLDNKGGASQRAIVRPPAPKRAPPTLPTQGPITPQTHTRTHLPKHTLTHLQTHIHTQTNKQTITTTHTDTKALSVIVTIDYERLI